MQICNSNLDKMDFVHLSSFLLTSFIITIMPGTDNIFVLTESLSKGSKNGIALSSGLAFGVLIHTLLVATGFALIIKKLNILFEIIKTLGAIYMFYLAIVSVFEKQVKTNISEIHSTDFDFLKIARKGFIMNILNPKVLIFFIAFLPQFVIISRIDSTFQIIIFGLIFMVQTIVIFSSIALISGKLSKFLNKPKVWKYTKYSKALILSLIGIYLLISV